MPLYQFERERRAKVPCAEHDCHRKVKCPRRGRTDVEQAHIPVGVKSAKKS